MSLNIKHPEADRLAREIAERTGENLTEVVIGALRERLAREEGRLTAPELAHEIMTIGKRCGSLPNLHARSEDEIIGYDEHGVPC